MFETKIEKIMVKISLSGIRRFLGIRIPIFRNTFRIGFLTKIKALPIWCVEVL